VPETSRCPHAVEGGEQRPGERTDGCGGRAAVGCAAQAAGGKSQGALLVTGGRQMGRTRPRVSAGTSHRVRAAGVQSSTTAVGRAYASTSASEAFVRNEE